MDSICLSLLPSNPVFASTKTYLLHFLLPFYGASDIQENWSPVEVTEYDF